MPFDPDAYLAKKKSSGFDPDAYLAKIKPSGPPSPFDLKQPYSTKTFTGQDLENAAKDVGQTFDDSMGSLNYHLPLSGLVSKGADKIMAGGDDKLYEQLKAKDEADQAARVKRSPIAAGGFGVVGSMMAPKIGALAPSGNAVVDAVLPSSIRAGINVGDAASRGNNPGGNALKAAGVSLASEAVPILGKLSQKDPDLMSKVLADAGTFGAGAYAGRHSSAGPIASGVGAVATRRMFGKKPTSDTTDNIALGLPAFGEAVEKLSPLETPLIQSLLKNKKDDENK